MIPLDQTQSFVCILKNLYNIGYNIAHTTRVLQILVIINTMTSFFNNSLFNSNFDVIIIFFQIHIIITFFFEVNST